MPGNSDVAVVQVLSFAALLEPSESCLQEQALLTMSRVLNGNNPFIILNHSFLLAQESCIPPSPIRILQAPRLSYRRPLSSDAPCTALSFGSTEYARHLENRSKRVYPALVAPCMPPTYIKPC